MEAFEAPTSALINGAHAFMKDCPKMEGAHNFQQWLVDLETAVQIINCDVILSQDDPPGHGTRAAAANVALNRNWAAGQAAVKGLILISISRDARASISRHTTVFQMMTELKARYTRKGGSRVAEIHTQLRATTLETSTNIHDFAAKLRICNDDLAAIHPQYALRKWEMNLHFLDNLTDAYDTFTTNILTSDDDFIEIDDEMDWQTLINKAAEVEAKSKARGARAIAYKASAFSTACTNPGCSDHSHVNAFATTADYENFKQAKKALVAARERAFCKKCNKRGHFDEDCWQQGNAPMPEAVKKKRKALEQKQKEEKEAKKAKAAEQVPANAGFVEEEEIFTCIADVMTLPATITSEVSQSEHAYYIDSGAAMTLPAYISNEISQSGHAYYIDSGAGRPISGNRSAFTSISNLDNPVIVTGVNGKTTVTQQGELSIRIAVNGRPKTMQVSNVLYVPGLPFTLLSVKAFARKGFITTFSEKHCEIIHKESQQVMAIGVSQTNTDLYRLVLADDTPIGTHAGAYHATIEGADEDDSAKETNIMLVHRRLGHLSEGHLRALPSVSKGLKLNGTFQFCEECALAKQTRRNSTKRPRRYKIRCERVHMDLSGPHPMSARGERFFLLLMDEATRFRWVYFLKQKSDVSGAIRHFLNMVERQTGLKIKRWHSDNGGEFISGIMDEIAKSRGIIHEPTAPYNPESNGSIEKSMHIVWNGARALFKDTELDISLWPEMVRTRIYLLNLSPTTALQLHTPYEAWEKVKPDLSYLKVLGSIGYKTTPRELLHKTSDRAEKCIPLGYGGSNQYRVYNLVKQRMELVRDIRFPNEGDKSHARIRPDISANHDPALPADQVSLPPNTTQSETSTAGTKRYAEEELDGPSKRTRSKTSYDEAMYTKCQQISEPSKVTILNEIQATIARLSNQDVDPATSVAALLASIEAFQTTAEETLRHPIDSDPQEPATYKRAMASPHAENWYKSMTDEMKSHKDNNTWTVVLKPTHRRVLGGRWVYRLKRGPGGEILRFKSRWVVRGFEQRYGIDFNETFATVVKPMTYKAIFTVCALYGWDIEQMDVKTAFLESDLDEEVYVELPAGFEQEGMVCRLNKALYGLKQAPRAWFKTLTDFLISIGFIALPEDPSVYKHDGVFIAIYVDDLLIFGPNKLGIAALKQRLSERFHMTDLGPVAYYLGLEVNRNRREKSISLSQVTYLRKIIADFKFEGLRGAMTPMEPDVILQPAADDYQAESSLKARYQSAVGSLMYLMLGTRPDIAFAVSQVARFASNPSAEHWTAVQRIFRYLKKHPNLGLVFSGDELLGYTDANWARDNDRRSTGGYLYKLGGAAISWSSKRQSTIALSSCEAEYMAASEAAKEAIWLSRLLNQLGYIRDSSQVVIQADNKSAIALANNPMHHGRSKHIELRHHFIREKVAEGAIKLTFVPTLEEAADGLTKPLGGIAFSKFIKELGLQTIETGGG